MPAFNQITPTQLNRLIGTPDVPVVIDVCLDEDFQLDPVLIPTARRMPFDDPHAIAAHVGDRRAVIVCQKGKKLSQSVAAYLQSLGTTAEVLEGGMLAWRASPDLPAIPTQAMPPQLAADGASLWVTRARPKIDRIACPWLIRRFIDPTARFLFVSSAEVSAVADRFNAIPFDTADADLSHSGNRCTFDAFLDRFSLRTPNLSTLADVVRAADTGTPEAHPAAPGLLAISVGLSRQFRNDQEQLDAGMTIYDALFRWARDGQNESHNWQEERT